MPPVSEMEKGTAEPKEDQSKKVPTTDDPGSLPATSLTQSTDVQSDGAGKTGESKMMTATIPASRLWRWYGGGSNLYILSLQSL